MARAPAASGITQGSLKGLVGHRQVPNFARLSNCLVIWCLSGSTDSLTHDPARARATPSSVTLDLAGSQLLPP
jgi:hypothetical protein